MQNATETTPKKNTRISYLYRDRSNYKVHNECIVEGVVTEDMKASILSCLDESIFFIPKLVGMPGSTFEDEGYAFNASEDHLWFELEANGFNETEEAPTIDKTAQELVGAFLACKDVWIWKAFRSRLSAWG